MNDFNSERFEQVLRDGSDPVARLASVLLWRGFLIERQGADLFLSAGSPSEDRHRLSRLGFKVKSLTKAKATQLALPGFIEDRGFLENIFYLETRNSGFTAPPHIPGTLPSFVRCQYGAEIPVEVLDSGIALLIKTLPAIGVLTVHSCSGHGKGSASIIVHDDWHLRWLRAVVTAYGCNVSPDLLKISRFKGLDEPSVSWMGRVWELDIPATGSQTLWQALHQMALDLMSPAVYEPIREIRRSITDEASFFQALETVQTRAFRGVEPVK